MVKTINMEIDNVQTDVTVDDNYYVLYRIIKDLINAINRLTTNIK